MKKNLVTSYHVIKHNFVPNWHTMLMLVLKLNWDIALTRYMHGMAVWINNNMKVIDLDLWV